MDRIAEELFGSPEATAVLLDYLKATEEGRRGDWFYGAEDTEDETMSLPRSPGAPTAQEDRLQHQIEEHWAEHDRLVAEFGEPDEAIDRLSEELFGSEAEAEVLLDYLRRTVEGPGGDDELDDDDAW